MGENNNIDYLTGLYNRKGQYEYFADAANKSYVSAMFMDLDNFKTVNDVYGHQAGDMVLAAFARILKECAPEGVSVRMGGDEFIVIFFGEQTKEQLSDIAEMIIAKTRESQSSLQYMSMISVSAGIIRNETDVQDLEQLLVKSDTAMYQAKQQGKSCYVFYRDIEEKIFLQKTMVDSAVSALRQGCFHISYAPVLNLQNSRLEQTDVYVSWRKDKDTVWKPEEYRPVLERNGFIRELDLHIFEAVCRDLYVFQKKYEVGLKIRIQLSRLLFLDDRIPEKLSEIMEKYQVEAKDLDLSIEETALGQRDSENLIENMNRLVEMGFSLSLINFGKNFFGIRYLRKLPIHMIQFDSAYLKDNIQNHVGRKVIKTLVKLGKELKLTVGAKGITKKDEVIFLRECGCDVAEGQFYSMPLKLKDYVKYAMKKISSGDYCITYPFQGDLCSSAGTLEGTVHGDGIVFSEGVSEKWGGIYFPGGDIGKNVVYLPESLFSANDYTLSFWIKPEAVTPWGSVLYMRYLAGFASLVYNIGDGVSAFRISEDDYINVWHDVLCRAVNLNKWSMLSITYDAFSETARYYINGRKAGYRTNVPTLISCRQVVLGGDPFQKSFRGTVSALMIYDSAKTDTEIASLYRSFYEEPGFRGELEEYWMDME